MAQPRILIVDTNVYLRLFFSSARPLLGVDIGGIKLVVIRELVDEFLRSPRLRRDYPWVAESPHKEELAAAILQLDAAVAATVAADTPWYLAECNAVLDYHCKSEQLDVIRTVSTCDATALTTALEVGAGFVTDEWPLRYVAERVEADDQGNRLEVWGSLDALAHFEKAGKIDREERVKTVLGWIRFGEKLPRDWDKRYQALFGEAAPRAN